MSEEKEYVVISKRGIDVETIDDDLGIDTSIPNVPDRPVTMANPRLGSTRMTHWWLTDEEAELLKNDPRIETVTIHPKDDPDRVVGFNSNQAGNYYRGNNSDNTQVNWGLKRVIESSNVWDGNVALTSDYLYSLDGTGVDIVIQDTGIQADHPEWQDANGVSRLQQINWYTESGLTGTQNANFYTDTNGHGTHCAGIAAGKTYGWAKNAHIYAMKFDALSDSTGMPETDIFDAIRLWHLAKTNGRPTVVNMSWGSSYSKYNQPTGGSYRGNAWTYTSETDNNLFDNYGLVSRWWNDGANDYRSIPASSIVTNIEIEDMIDAGIHVCIAAGNSFNVADIPAGIEYNNYATIDGFNYYYHRPGSPYSDRAFYVGNIDSIQYLDGTYKDVRAFSSVNGPAVNIWAPGTDITSTDSTVSEHVQLNYPGDSNYKITNISGTSMASPQIAGLCALYLQSIPQATPEQLLAKVIADSKGVIYDFGSTVYRHYVSLNGSENRMAFSRYGQNTSFGMTLS